MANKQIVPFGAAGAPAHARKKSQAMESFTSGLSGGGFPVLGIRGSKWRIKFGGDERPLLDREQNPVPTLQVVVLAANQGLAKTYYKKAYSEGDDANPDCWSLDGTVPDPQVDHPVSKKCMSCPMNKWGSKITPQGTKTKMCSDTKRLAIMLANDLSPEPKIGPMLLRVPPASITKGDRSLRALHRDLTGADTSVDKVVIKLGFDLDADYPKITFTPVRYTTPEEDKIVTAMQGEEVVSRITSSMVDAVANEPAEGDADEVEVNLQTGGQAEVEEDEGPSLDALGLGDDGGEEEEEEEEEPAPKPKATGRKSNGAKTAAKPKPKPKAKPVEEEEEEEEEDGDGSADPFEANLAKLQGLFN